MRLLRFDYQNKKWVQLFADSGLDKYANLSDLDNIEEARRNLELDKYYWNKDSLKTGTALNAISPVCINQDTNNRFVTDRDKTSWNNKVDRPLYGETTTETMTEGQILFDPSTDIAQFMLNGQLRSIKMGISKFAISGMITGSINFLGKGQEQKIAHGATLTNGTAATPKSVFITPAGNPYGTLGEVWTRWDDNGYIYIGNTGSYTGVGNWTVLF